MALVTNTTALHHFTLIVRAIWSHCVNSLHSPIVYYRYSPDDGLPWRLLHARHIVPDDNDSNRPRQQRRQGWRQNAYDRLTNDSVEKSILPEKHGKSREILQDQDSLLLRPGILSFLLFFHFVSYCAFFPYRLLAATTFLLVASLFGIDVHKFFTSLLLLFSFLNNLTII